MMTQAGLRGLKPRKVRGGRGGRSKLTTEQHRRLKQIIKRGARAAGFETERWTLERVRRVIAREFQVSYYRNYLARLLRRLGLTPLQPILRATERDEALVRAWLSDDWPRIKETRAAKLA